MALAIPVYDRSTLADVVFARFGRGRFTLDGPAAIPVWESYGIMRNRTINPQVPHDLAQSLLLTPVEAGQAHVLAGALRSRLEALYPQQTIAVHETPNLLNVNLTLEQMVMALLPLSQEWRDTCQEQGSALVGAGEQRNLLESVSINRPAFLC